MQQFHLLNKTLRSIFTKLTHLTCNSPSSNKLKRNLYAKVNAKVKTNQTTFRHNPSNQLVKGCPLERQ